MSEELKVVELDEEAMMDSLDDVAGGAATVTVDGVQYKIVTGITKKCSSFNKGPNEYKALAIKGTCGQCRHLISRKGWQLCKISATT